MTVSDPGADESISRVVYEELVHLTFLAGSGLSLPKLMTRFLKAFRPRVPASALWLFDASGCLARADDGAQAEPPAPPLDWQGLVAHPYGEGLLRVSVIPEAVLVCRPITPGTQRTIDVLALFARMLALAWQAEAVSCAGVFVDDYKTAKNAFKRHWLQALLDRHDGNVAASARASGLSRPALYEMMRLTGAGARVTPPSL